MWTSAQFGIEPQLEPDTGDLGDGWSEMRGHTATDGLHLLAKRGHRHQSTAQGTWSRSGGGHSTAIHSLVVLLEHSGQGGCIQ